MTIRKLLAVSLAILPVHLLAQEAVETAGVAAGEYERLPDPLSLRDALVHAREYHPDVARSKAARSIAYARLGDAESRYDIEAYLELDARTVDKVADSGRQFRDDSRATLYVSRLLTDFGEGRAAVAAARAGVEGAEIATGYRRIERDISIMRRFLEVKLADLRYFVEDEDMTLAFLRYNRVQERRELFQEFAEVEERELETVFRDRLVDRTRAANTQRMTRNRLALAMGRPGELPSRVQTPDLSVYDRPQPDYDDLLEEVLGRHPLLVRHRRLVEAAEHKVRQIELSARARLTAQLEATEWSLEVGNRDRYLAGLRLDVPLGGSAARNAKLAEAVAERDRLVADRMAIEYQLRDELLELVQGLHEASFEADAARTNERYRDLYLDRSRTLYQMEVRSDLGDSQARQAEAIWRGSRAEFDRAMIWARIDAMRGLPLAILHSEESQ